MANYPVNLIIYPTRLKPKSEHFYVDVYYVLRLTLPNVVYTLVVGPWW